MGMHGVFEDELGGTVAEAQSLEPLAVQDAPGLGVLGSIDLAAKQEFADSVADPGQVDAEVLSTADQVSQLLLVRLRNAHQSKLAGAEQTGQRTASRLSTLMWSVAFLRMCPGRRPRRRGLAHEPAGPIHSRLVPPHTRPGMAAAP